MKMDAVDHVETLMALGAAYAEQAIEVDYLADFRSLPSAGQGSGGRARRS